MTRSRQRKLMRARSKNVQGKTIVRAALTGLPLASMMIAGAPIASAQEATADASGLQEVVVSAQKRDENLQSVPLSIQAFGTEQLEEMHISGFNDYAKLLPSVSFQTLGPGFARVFMRGVASGDNGNHSGSLPSVGVYLDEQPVTTIQGPLDIHVYDIARVEALAGPQGTLYGASSQAGTIRIITNKPDPKGFKAGYDLTLNTVTHGDEGYVAEGFTNIPVSSNAAIRLVGWVERDAGYIDNVLTSREFPVLNSPTGIVVNNANRVEDDYNTVDTYGARAALRVDLNDSWTITPTIMGQEQESNGGFAYDPALGELNVFRRFAETSKDRWGQAALAIEGRMSNFDLVYTGSFLKRDVTTRSDYSDYSYWYDVLYYDTPGYFGQFFTNDNGDLIDPSQHIDGEDKYKKQSHEIRLSSPAEHRFRAVGGLFYQRQTHDIQQVYRVDNLASATEVPGWPDTLWLTKQDRVDRDYAFFTEGSFDITDKLTATAGIRLFKAQNSLEGFYGFGTGYSSQTGVAACDTTGPNSLPFNGAPCKNLDKAVDETGNTPKFNLTYNFDEQKLVYVTYSEGFRPGGVNRRGTFPAYDADYLKNYEVGWKTMWAGNRLRLNGAVFLLDWDDFQFSFLGENGLTNITNAGKARIRGIETDLDWAATDSMLFSAGFAVLDAELADNFCRQLDANGVQLTPDQCDAFDFAPDGQRLPITPKFKGNVTSRYSFNVSSFDAHAQGSFTYQSSAPSALLPGENAIQGDQRSFGLLDLSTGVTRNGFSVELFVNNVLDKQAELYRYVQCAVDFCGPNTYVVTNPPRTIGVKFGQSF